MEIYLIRHGQGEGNKQLIMHGSTDSPLSAKGRIQAENLKNRLPPFDAIYSSSLSRAVETAKISTGLDPIKIDELQELHLGEFEGSKLDDSIRNNPEMRDYFGLINDRIISHKNLESHKSFLKRIIKGFNKIISNHNNMNDVIAIFSHGVTMRGILQNHLKILEGTDAMFSNTESIVLEYNEDFKLLKRIKNVIPV